MKVYVSSSIGAEDESRELLKQVSDYMETRGHKVNKYRIDKSFKIRPEYNENDLGEFHKKMMNSIKQCDVMIVDITTKSSGVGYEIAVALNERKPILALYDGDSHKSFSLRSNPSKLLHLQKYDKATYKQVVDKFLEDSKDQVDTKFILIISPEIDKYLEWASAERRMHKAQIVRNAVEDMMSKDKDYKAFLKSID